MGFDKSGRAIAGLWALAVAGCAQTVSTGTYHRDVLVDIEDASAQDSQTPIDNVDAKADADVRLPDPVLTGLGSNAVVVGADDGATDTYRIYYRDRLQTLRMERRSAVTHRRLCGVSLGLPPGTVRIEGVPAVGAPSNVIVVIATQAGDGEYELWSIEQSSRSGSQCDRTFGPWTRVPWPVELGRLDSAPTAAHTTAEGLPVVQLGIRTSQGRVAYTSRPAAMGTMWNGWRLGPAPAPGRRMLSRPCAVSAVGRDDLRYFALFESSTGRRTMESFNVVPSTGSSPQAWLADDVTRQDGPITAIVMASTTRTLFWAAYRGLSGETYVRGFRLAEGSNVFGSWSLWQSLGRLSDRPNHSLSMGVLGDWMNPSQTLLFDVDEGPSRALHLQLHNGTRWDGEAGLGWSVVDGLE